MEEIGSRRGASRKSKRSVARMTPLKTTLAIAALAAGAAAAIPDASGATAPQLKDRADAGWTRTLDVDLTPRRLNLPADVAPRRLARAALKRHAPRLGLKPSLNGVRVARELRLPAGPEGAAPLRSLRFQQTIGGVRVVWSKLDVAVTRRGVSSITATVVPITRDRPRRGRRVSPARALRIARDRVRGPERTLSPQLVAYAGKPTTRKTRPHAPRLAYVVEALPDRELEKHSPTPLCVVIAADSGKVIATWKGHVARTQRPRSVTAAQAGPGDFSVPAILTYDAHGASLGTGGRGELHQGWRTKGDPFVLANWPSSDHRTFTDTFNPDLDALNSNMGRVVKHMCFTRFFCSRDGLRDGTWEPLLATGNARDTGGGGIFILPSRVVFSARSGRADDFVAHELGHQMDYFYSDDRVNDTDQAFEVAEALADMFAYDYDREDATWAEDIHGSGPLSRNWAEPGAVITPSGDPYPALMDEYDCGAFDSHFNSTILSHAYYLFVQKVGHPVAGYVLHNVPFALPPRPTFVDVKNAFLALAQAIYGNTPQVPAAARRSFVDEVGIADPGCGRRVRGGDGPTVPPTEDPTPG
jgi:hypothetical protein